MNRIHFGKMMATIGAALLLGGVALAHVAGGDYNGSCSPHNAPNSKGGSEFFNCSHQYSYAQYPRSVACALSSDCYSKGYQPVNGACTKGYVTGTSTQTSSHALAPSWEAWTCENKRTTGQSCGGHVPNQTVWPVRFSFMCQSKYCTPTTATCGACIPNGMIGDSCTSDSDCCSGNVCNTSSGMCGLPDDALCHASGSGVWSTCAFTQCTGLGRSPGVCKPADQCWCGDGLA